MEGYISHGVDIMESNQNTSEEVLSPDDIAWADSCLANDIGIPGNALDFWSNLTDALNETTISKPNPSLSRREDISSEGGVFSTSQYMDTVDISSWLSTSVNMKNMDATVDGIFTSNLESAPLGFGDILSVDRELPTSQNMDTNVVDGIFTSAPSGWGDVSSVVRELLTSQNMDATVEGIFNSIPEVIEHSEYKVISEEADLIPGSKFNLKNVFQPTYNEDSKEGGSISYDYEQVEASGLKQEESFEDIFKVWNLETHVEDGEFVKQFNKAFSESAVGVSSPYDLESGTLDDVIRNMGDLTLNHVA